MTRAMLLEDDVYRHHHDQPKRHQTNTFKASQLLGFEILTESTVYSVETTWTNSTCPKTPTKIHVFFLKRQRQGYRPQATRFDNSSVHGLAQFHSGGRAAGPCSIQSLVSLRRHRTGQIIIFHQPGFPWNKVPLLPYHVGWGRVRLL